MQADETREKAEMDYDRTPMGGSMQSDLNAFKSSQTAPNLNHGFA